MHEPRERTPTLPLVELAAIAVVGTALAVTVGMAFAWRRAARATEGWRERALAAEAIGREQQLEAREDRWVRDLILSTMHEGVLLIGREADVVFANEAIGQHLQAVPTSLDSILPFALR